MNVVFSKFRASLWWLLPLAGLVTLIALETDLGRALHLQVPAQPPVPAKPVAVSLLPEYTIEGGIAKYSETVSRPLFVPTRRPAPVAVVEVAKPKMPRGQFALTGTTVAGERSLAFLKEVNGGKSRTVKMGDTINGLMVAEVKSDRVKLTFGDEAEELVLKVASNPKMTPQPAGAAPGTPGAPVPQPSQLVAQPPGAPPQPAVAGAPEHTESLAERRRAARAAQAAAAAAQEASTQGGAAPPPTTPPPQPSGNAGQAETGWAAIYQRYQQRRN